VSHPGYNSLQNDGTFGLILVASAKFPVLAPGSNPIAASGNDQASSINGVAPSAV